MKALRFLRVTALAATVAACVAAPAAAEDPYALADRVIGAHRLLTQKQRKCSFLMLRDDSSARIAKVGVYEKHDKACGGDPQVSHRLFDLEIDMKTRAAKWDYDSSGGEMLPVPGRKK